jgi:L-iditol 2-dehydrogenase
MPPAPWKEVCRVIPKSMKACMLTGVNQFAIRDIPVPTPGPFEALCRIKAIAICGTDPEIVRGTYLNRNWPPEFPFVLGHEWSGEIVKLGEGVSGFKVGDRVAGEAHKGCGYCANCLKGNYTLCLNYGRGETGHRHYGFTNPGANCEFNAYSIKAIRKIPDSLSFPHAALLDTAGVALHGIKLIGITPGGTVVVFGPGPIGLCAMQIAKGMGAKTVVMVGRGHRLSVAKQIGADVVINFEKEDPVARVMEITGGLGADEILECSGAAVTPMQSIDCVKKGGKIDLIGFYEDEHVYIPSITKLVVNEILITGSRANPNVSDEVIRLFEAGVLKGDKVVSHRFPLEKYPEGFDTFVNRRDGAIKVVIEP